MPAKKETKWHGGRALLNLPGHQSTAAIVAEIEDTREAPKSRRNAPDFTFQLSNCDRSIAFELEFYGEKMEEGFANDLHKVNTLIDVLTSFRDGLVIEQALHLSRRRRRS